MYLSLLRSHDATNVILISLLHMNSLILLAADAIVGVFTYGWTLKFIV